MTSSISKCAMIEISVTTAGGVVPIEGAAVTVTYNVIPGLNENASQTLYTNKNGRTEVFKLPIKCVMLGGRWVDLPRHAECNVEICAQGYTTLRVRGVRVFSNITVVSSFDLLPINGKSEIQYDYNI